MKKISVVAALWLLAFEPGQSVGPVTFVDVTAKSGVRFSHNNGATGKKYLPETFGPGCLFLDVDADGWQDILFVNSTRFAGEPGTAGTPALYRNKGDGTFVDITRASGLGVEMYGLGGSAADYDNDGMIDVFITTLAGGRLFRNTGGGKFTDVTKAAAIASSGFTTSAMWFDYDKDGALDLFVGRYVEWSPKTDIYCSQDGKAKSYCTPESYPGVAPVLYHNRRNGTFEDVSKRAGLSEQTLISIGKPYVLPRMSKVLGLAMLDFDADGWMDVFVANDTTPNNLFRNKGDGTFTDVAMSAGVAMPESGVARAGMGVDAADYDGSGRPSLVIGNFSNEMMSLYHNEGRGLFIDDAPAAGIGNASLLMLTFGCFFFDFDLDGQLDIFAANGHVVDDIEKVQARVKYRQPPHLFRNLGKKKFANVINDVGAELRRAIVARGTAYADIDHDGDQDLVLTTNGGPAYLYRNDGGNTNHVLRVVTEGTTSNRSGVGARVELQLAGGAKPWQIVKTGSSYLSQSELALTFGLGAQTSVAGLRVTWPNGKSEVTSAIKADHVVTLKEGAGILRTEPIKRGTR